METTQASGQGDDLRDLRLRDFRPRSELRVQRHEVSRPRFPVVDAHVHIRHWDEEGRRPEELVALMDEMGVETVVDLDGYWEETLDRRIERYQSRYPDRFVIFGRVDIGAAMRSSDPGARAAAQLRDNVRRGARGLKVWKDFGLHIRDGADRLVPVDDERLDELWAAAGELGVPVLIHVGDPAAFFRPLDADNERVVELLRHPDWHFYPGFPSLEDIVGQLERLVRRHPATTFIGAHVGCYPEDLGWVGALMDVAPNWHVDIAARVPELGRQPRATRRLIERHPDRVLFGTDHLGPPALNAIYYRFLETDDEYFPYSVDPHRFGSGFWHISGAALPDELLRAVYRDNARRILGIG
jgi:predicted TIM-barrel fold metal-dependent hydrolase